MSDENTLEVYRQRYETFRHFDTLRWQMLQTAVASAGIVLALGKDSIGAGMWWLWASVGGILLALGAAMLKVNSGIIANSLMLKSAGEKLGDDRIPDQKKRRSVANWIALFMCSIGSACLVGAIYKWFYP
jgi:hypothetical protein